MHREALRPDVRNEVSHEIRDQYLDASRARALLGWRCQYDLEAGLRKTIAWYETFLGETRAVLS
jgi:CDP-glucose 4,6-dehydratase